MSYLKIELSNLKFQNGRGQSKDWPDSKKVTKHNAISVCTKPKVEKFWISIKFPLFYNQESHFELTFARVLVFED